MPETYRLLNVGEEQQEGDEIFDVFMEKWDKLTEYELHGDEGITQVVRENDFPIRRKLDGEVLKAKPCALLNDLIRLLNLYDKSEITMNGFDCILMYLEYIGGNIPYHLDTQEKLNDDFEEFLIK